MDLTGFLKAALADANLLRVKDCETTNTALDHYGKLAAKFDTLSAQVTAMSRALREGILSCDDKIDEKVAQVKAGAMPIGVTWSRNSRLSRRPSLSRPSISPSSSTSAASNGNVFRMLPPETSLPTLDRSSRIPSRMTSES